MKKKTFVKVITYILLYAYTVTILSSTVMLSQMPVESTAITLIRTVIIFFASTLLFKYTLYMLLSPWYEPIMRRRFRQLAPRLATYRPLVSVIIPAWNEEVGLLGTIKTILNNNYSPLEIVVVNDGSTDRSDEIMRNFLQAYERATQGIENRPTLIYHYQQNGGKGSALNTGIRLSHGEIILSVDADCIVDQDCVRNYVRYFADPQVMAAVGNVKIGNTGTLVGTIQHLEYLFSFYFKKADALMNTIYIIGGAAGAFRREVFNRVGLYSTTNITEDIELSVRIQKAGMKIVYCPDAVIITEGASSLKGLMKQRLRWKRGRFETFLQHRDLFFSCKRRHNKLLTWFILPMALFGDVQLGFELLFIMVLYLFALFSHDFSAFISGILVVSLIFFIQLFDDQGKYKKHPAYLLLAPIGWVLFYLTTIVEFNALVRSLWGLLLKKELKWQKWRRTGAID
ncbi:MAG: glycosyltransferase family 2 protein [Ktedonobacteraceae bacterium]|nr:glycosyltransferase family 2 protein [Ktedonobacteraceae bacterium]